MKNNELNRKMKEFFNGISDSYYENIDKVKHDMAYFHQKELEFVLKNISHKRPLKILDAGCGPGRHTVELAKRGHNVTALDFSEKMLEKCEENAILGGEVMNKIAFIRGDVRNLSFDDSYFDVVVNTEVLEHLPGYLQDDEKAIREFNRVLKNKGQLFVEFPLNLHFYLHLIPFSRPTLKGSSIRDWQRKLLVSNTFREKIMRELLLTYNFQITTKKYIRVIPAGLIERLQILSTLDHYLELTPFLNNLSREVIFACQKG